MNVVRIDKSARVKFPHPLNVGEVYRQGLVDDLSKTIRIGVTYWENGAHNLFHTHDNDQVLIVTEGQSLVATETEQRVLTAGDVVFFPAGEKHMHGAQPGHSTTHISIMAVTPGQTDFAKGAPPK